MFHVAITWIVGAIVAAADLFGTMIGLAEVWLKGALSIAVILLVFTAPYLAVREVNRARRRARAVKELDSGRELGRAVRWSRQRGRGL
jgi:membrane-bound ClpP family serine protease